MTFIKGLNSSDMALGNFDTHETDPLNILAFKKIQLEAAHMFSAQWKID